MAFPQVAATNNSAEADNTTSHTVNLPTGIVAGNLLLVFFATDGDNTCTWPSGWTEIFSVNNSITAHLSVAYKKATGSEGSTITVTTSSSETSAHISYRITDMADPVTQAPEVSTGATGTDSMADPDSLTPTGGAKDYLWIAVEGNDDDDCPFAYPFNYTNGEYKADGTGGPNVSVARRELNASSENPRVFYLDAAEQWIACTVAVHPAGGVDVSISATTATGDGAALNPTFSGGVGVSGVLATGSGSAPVPTLSIGSSLLPPLATADGVSLVPILSIGSTLLPPLATGDGGALVPSVGIGTSISAILATADGVALIPSVGIGVSITVVLATADGDSPVPTLSIGSTLLPPLATSDGSAPTPSVGAGVGILAVLATADGAGLIPLNIFTTTGFHAPELIIIPPVLEVDFVDIEEGEILFED